MTPGASFGTTRFCPDPGSINCSSLAAPRSTMTASVPPVGEAAKPSMARSASVTGAHALVARSPRQIRSTSDSRSLSAKIDRPAPLNCAAIHRDAGAVDGVASVRCPEATLMRHNRVSVEPGISSSASSSSSFADQSRTSQPPSTCATMRAESAAAGSIT